jgi:REP element-mobilizing transposase RayT
MRRMPAPNPNPLRTHDRIILAHHIIMTLYGHWPPNDPRGSGSIDFYDNKFDPLGPIHHGRKPPEEQPSRDELRKYHKQVKPLLNFPIFWLNDATQQVVADAIREVVRKNRYTCYACAICSNHLHLVIRKRRDSYEEMWAHLASAIKERLVASHLVVGGTPINEHHPVISQRPYAVFLYTRDDIRGRINYAESNPEKEGLARQHYDFVTLYDDWPPEHRQRQRRRQ